MLLHKRQQMIQGPRLFMWKREYCWQEMIPFMQGHYRKEYVAPIFGSFKWPQPGSCSYTRRALVKSGTPPKLIQCMNILQTNAPQIDPVHEYSTINALKIGPVHV
jgi:hypothetical protein